MPAKKRTATATPDPEPTPQEKLAAFRRSLVPPDFPRPEHVQEPGATGTPVVLNDGREWLLADAGFDGEIATIRDRIYVLELVAGNIPGEMILEGLWHLLRANYRITEEMFASLAGAIDLESVYPALFRALMGYFNGKDGPQERGYSEWMRSQLLANGLDPASIPNRDLHLVLETLVATGRAIPASKFVDAAKRQSSINILRSMAGKA